MYKRRHCHGGERKKNKPLFSHAFHNDVQMPCKEEDSVSFISTDWLNHFIFIENIIIKVAIKWNFFHQNKIEFTDNHFIFLHRFFDYSDLFHQNHQKDTSLSHSRYLFQSSLCLIESVGFFFLISQKIPLLLLMLLFMLSYVISVLIRLYVSMENCNVIMKVGVRRRDYLSSSRKAKWLMGTEHSKWIIELQWSVSRCRTCLMLQWLHCIKMYLHYYSLLLLWESLIHFDHLFKLQCSLKKKNNYI